ncbi:MAG: 50S ribosomal protein L11 methyltransferase [Prevotellaceae bacterium]|jgi:ribosomal protein L11 methyltransferase|nr:50S ribosomal protein L11 methyltransferase [Prevotellaceae bacterium]
MNYIEVIFSINQKEAYIFDLLAQQLSENGFESFTNDTQTFSAFISENNFSENTLKETLHNFEFAGFDSYTIKKIESKNWNEEWEKNFYQPVVVGNKCVIHSAFHQNVPQMEYDIIVNPKMAFGTGHHFTTQMMLEFVLETQIADKQVLDMGCGTAILTILAMMRGAKSCLAIDIDDWCVENAQENILLNNINNVEILQGDAKVLTKRRFDLILANINRNILLADMQIYANCLNASGQLFISGFYVDDAVLLTAEAKKMDLQLVDTKQNNNWCALKFSR